MGIDKPDVRYVIHYSLSQSLEAYYQVRIPARYWRRVFPFADQVTCIQETGRAGRDGQTSDCLLFFAYGDTNLINRLIDEGDGTREQKEANKANVRRMVQYCLNEADCRRSQVLNYFGEKFEPKDCHKTCDNCRRATGGVLEDVREMAKAAVQLVSSIEHDKGVTMIHAIDVFRGSKTAKVGASPLSCLVAWIAADQLFRRHSQIKQKGHDRLEFAGAGKLMARGDVERLFQLLASEGVLGERFERNGLGYTNAYVVLGKRNREVLAGKMPLTMSLAGGKKVANGTGNAGGYETEYDDEDEAEEDEIEVVPTQVVPTAGAGVRPTRQAAEEAKQRLGRTASALSVEGSAPDDSLEGRALGELLQARAAVSGTACERYVSVNSADVLIVVQTALEQDLDAEVIVSEDILQVSIKSPIWPQRMPRCVH